MKHFHIKRFNPRVIWHKRDGRWRWLWGVFATRQSRAPFACASTITHIMALAKRRHERYIRGKK